MARITELTPFYCKTIPKPLEVGILYISEEYGISIHKCACNRDDCSFETVLPFDNEPRGWFLVKEDDGATVSFTPSIGNWHFPCKSHYYITKNKIVWC